jgi:hypothetical protein
MGTSLLLEMDMAEPTGGIYPFFFVPECVVWT